MVKRNGIKRGKQAYRCNQCGYRWIRSRKAKTDFVHAYQDWLFQRKTLKQLSQEMEISLPTLRAGFDAVPAADPLKPAPSCAITLIIDATFFGRDYGYLCFCDGQQIVYFMEIKTESLAVLQDGIGTLVAAGYRFKSVTLDGKRGFIQYFKRRFPGLPVQMCHYHQQAIIRRYITNKPKTDCGKDLKHLMKKLGTINAQLWIDNLHAMQDKHRIFLNEKNEKGKFTHSRLRAAFRSINTMLPHLFIYQEIPQANIPNTTNGLEGRFAHLKEKITLHRGGKLNRKKKAIRSLLSRL